MPGVAQNPDISLAIQNANNLVGNTKQKVLFVAQQTAAATAGPGALTVNIGNDQLIYEGLYGIDSMMAEALRAGRKENPITQIDAIGVSDNVSGVAATGTLGIAGTATADGSLKVSIGSGKTHVFTVSVLSGQAATVGPGIVPSVERLDI